MFDTGTLRAASALPVAQIYQQLRGIYIRIYTVHLGSETHAYRIKPPT